MDPYSSPYIIPNNNPYNPFPHSRLSTRGVGNSWWTLGHGRRSYGRCLGFELGVHLEIQVCIRA